MHQERKYAPFDLHQSHVYFSQQTFELTWPLAKTTALDLEHSSILRGVMTTSLKKLLLVLVTLLLGVMSVGLRAQSVTQVSGSEYAYNNGSTTTNYDLSTVVYNGSNSSTIVSSANPWNGSQATAGLFAGAVGSNMGLPNQGGIVSPLFQYDINNIVYFYSGKALTTEFSLYTGYTYAVATVHAGAAPEIDGSLAPKVGFLLGCLFLMFGRKKQISEPMMTA